MEKYRNRLRLHVLFIGRIVKEGEDEDEVKKEEIREDEIEEKNEEDKENISIIVEKKVDEDQKKVKKEVEEDKHKEAKRMEQEEKEKNKKIREKKILEEMKRKVESKFLVSSFLGHSWGSRGFFFIFMYSLEKNERLEN